VRSRHRVGRPWNRARQEMFAIYGRTCIHCGHGGAGEADHVIPLAEWPDQPVDPHAMRPSHGSNYRCPTCKGSNGLGRACNQERGVKPLSSMFRPTMEW
jgi:5-methylcytosine-specific restriction endonuclease McrA